MKQLLLLAVLFFIGIYNAQGNLQFNQVKLVSVAETMPIGTSRVMLRCQISKYLMIPFGSRGNNLGCINECWIYQCNGI